MCDDTHQLTLDGKGQLVLPRQLAQQLALFLGQGPGGTADLPDGSIVDTEAGPQWTMDLAGAAGQTKDEVYVSLTAKKAINPSLTAKRIAIQNA
jgi:hypothetical protein